MSEYRRLPRSYNTAAQLLQKMEARKGSLNSLISGLNQKNVNFCELNELVII